MTIEFTTDGVDVSNTSIQGFITCSYDTLCQVFGEPVSGDGYKTRAEWNGKTSDGIVFTIYDWKERKGIGDVTNWHIGGNDLSAVEAVQNIVKNNLGDLSAYAVKFDLIRWF